MSDDHVSQIKYAITSHREENKLASRNLRGWFVCITEFFVACAVSMANTLLCESFIIVMVCLTVSISSGLWIAPIRCDGWTQIQRYKRNARCSTRSDN